ncbi:calcium-binding protein [Loktanella sp. S4079]|uniref:calcium-binding protein n=1 Tax=Loktanella sp. S4079 TaxID=579483 RepID=UPI0005FA6C50|nr:M10 family metallopeptidase C-terminal domain-containing protein [Loktanella sp. S4079]KJZ19260.1 hypothetical protein TW80_10740 [Loktanella sp. S4079]
MSEITLVTYLSAGEPFAYSHIAELSLVSVNGTDFLYSTTEYDGVLVGWNISGTVPVMIDSYTYDGVALAGVSPSLCVITFGGVTSLLSGGAENGQLQLISLNPDGTFYHTSDLPVTGLHNYTAMTLGDGTSVVISGVANGDGIARILFDSTGGYIGDQNSKPAGAFTDHIAATEVIEISGNQYAITASQTDAGITSWEIDVSGNLLPRASIGPDQNLWIDTPTVMQSVEIDGKAYVIVGASGSGSLTVLQLLPDGTFEIRDHILDTLDTRFNGIAALDVVEHHGQTYVIAGGSDDGISIFLLMEDGTLLPRAHIADSPAMGLDNVSDIVGLRTESGIELYVSSSSEQGLTKLRYETAQIGLAVTAEVAGSNLNGTAAADVLIGLAGDDTLIGGDGADILRDGSGSDLLTGGAGADVFVLSADGADDTITDFTIGEDVIDLSRWSMLRDVSQLTMRITADGAEIIYGDERLILHSSDGLPIDYRQFTNSDLIAVTRIPQDVTSGYPGPAIPNPDTGTEPPPADDPSRRNPLSSVTTIASDNFSTIVEAIGDDVIAPPGTPGAVIVGNTTLNGSASADVLIGGTTNDLMNGADGDDTLLGRDGNDHLNGDAGADLLIGGAGDDQLDGGTGQDILRGGEGADTLHGGAGNDILFGDAGADTFIFDGGTDVIADFAQGDDHITLSETLWTGLTSVDDLILIYGTYTGTTMTISFDDDNILVIENVTDPSILSDDITLF